MSASADLAASLERPAPGWLEELLRLARPGLHASVPERVYHARALGYASKHALDLVLRSPAHYKAWVDGVTEEEDKPAFALGRAAHCAALERQRYADEYAVAPDFGDCRKKENRIARDAWRAENAGKTPISAEDARIVDGMVESLMRHPLVGRMLQRGGMAEATVCWDDEDVGLPCKARVDWYSPDLEAVLDLKTTEDASFNAFQRDCANFSYYRQDSFYRDGFLAINRPLREFVFAVVEKKPPHLVAVYRLDPDALRLGEHETREALRSLAGAVTSGVFRGYPESIQTLSLPRWKTRSL